MYEITVVLDTNQAFIHQVKTAEDVQKNAEEILKNGYIHNGKTLITHFPVHRIRFLTYQKKELKLPIEKAN